MATGIVLHGVSSPTFTKIAELRRLSWDEALWDGALTDLNLLNDDHDDHAYHFALFSQNTVIAAARLCMHELLSDVPDPHLFQKAASSLAAPFGCLNRLVVHPEYRKLGIAAIMDKVRTDAAKILGCNTILVVWNGHSGDRRRQAIQAQGFSSVAVGEAVDDGVWGNSYPYAKCLDSDAKNNSEPSGICSNLQIFSDKLNGLLTHINNSINKRHT